MFVVLSLWFTINGLAADEDNRGEAFRASYLQWQADIAFRSNFKWRAASFPSRKDAQESGWEWDGAPSGKVARGSGFIAKMGQQLRVSFEPDFDPIPIPGTGGGATAQFQFLGYDEITDHRLHLRRYGERSRRILFDDVAIVHARTIVPGGLSAYATMSSVDLPTPLRPFKILPSDPFEFGGVGHSETTPPSMIATDDGQIQVSLTCEAGNDLGTRVLTFEGKEDHVLTRAAETWSRRNGNEWVATGAGFEVELSEYVPVIQGRAARRIRHTVYDESGPVRCEEVYCATLGDAAPTEADFRYEVPRGVPISGLKQTADVMVARTVALTELQDADVLPFVELPESAATPQLPGDDVDRRDTAGDARIWIVVANAAIAALAVAWILWRRRKRI